ncbi:uncharacterized protein Hqrw_1141 [Haloquadratum walsbyi C23]|uniref:Uncharacterized protein n=1 Tax=Haloquadratum walsbyi (strain DSM 16854 / JCM 12705 / C23) TaxID=768065 RepID=G0LG90_HALWC|nr:uncharacterized protein Hqrw_1141 [Haloquadratum walsbyi C23]
MDSGILCLFSDAFHSDQLGGNTVERPDTTPDTVRYTGRMNRFDWHYRRVVPLNILVTAGF